MLTFLCCTNKKVSKGNNTPLIMSTHSPKILIFNSVLNKRNRILGEVADTRNGRGKIQDEIRVPCSARM